MNRASVLVGAGVVALLALAALHHVAAPPARQAGNAARLDCAARWAAGFELHGAVGGRESRAYFDMAPVFDAPEGVSGVVLFPGDGARTVLADAALGLAGSLGADGCSIELTERGTEMDGTVWSLRLASAVQVTGHRRSPDGRTDSVLFSIVPRASCGGEGAWRTFSSPEWPIAFEYPAAWVITRHYEVAPEVVRVFLLDVEPVTSGQQLLLGDFLQDVQLMHRFAA